MKHSGTPRNNGDGNAERQISRRRFLRRSLIPAALAVVPRHVLGGPDHVPPSDKITLAGIGMGGQGLQNMLALLRFDETQVIAVCDVNRESRGYLSWNWNQGNEKRLFTPRMTLPLVILGMPRQRWR